MEGDGARRGGAIARGARRPSRAAAGPRAAAPSAAAPSAAAPRVAGPPGAEPSGAEAGPGGRAAPASGAGSGAASGAGPGARADRADPRLAVWRAIEGALAQDLAAGRYGPGDRLPSEADLARRFDVHRHTVRRALAALAQAGLVRARRGAGVFARAPEPARTDYALGERVRFSDNLERAGRAPGGRTLRVETRAASPSEARALAVEPGAAVVVYEALKLADGVPLALVHSVFPSARLPGLARALADLGSVTAALRACGVEDYRRVRTRVAAEAATPLQARHLEIASGAPLLRTDALNADPEDRPVERGRTWFAGARVALTVGG